MSKHGESHYQVTCECGVKLKPHEKECVCPNCGRTIVIEWPAEVAVKAKGATT